MREQQKQKKSLRVNLCRKLSHHSTRKDSVSDRKTNTNRFATFGGCNHNRGGESYMFCNSYAGQVHSAMDRSVSILSAWLSTCWQPPAWRTALYEKQLGHAIHRTIFYRIFNKRDLSIYKRTANAQLVIELGFCILFGNDHLLIIISRGEVWTKQYAVQEFLARSKQAIYLRTSRIVF